MKVGYNSQRDNQGFGRQYPGSVQCMSTCAWMLMSAYSKKIKATDDDGLALYVDDCEASLGKPGIGERAMQLFPWVKKPTSQWWLTHQLAITEYLNKEGVKGKAVYVDKCSWDDFYKLVEKGPVMIGTGFFSGHIILAVGKDVYHDPFGNAVGNYANQNGESVFYSREFLQPITDKVVGKGFIRLIYWSPA